MTAGSGDGVADRRALWIGVAVLLLLVGLAGVWAGRTLLAPPDALPPGRSYAVVAVEEGSVQRSLRLDAAARWAGGSPVTNRASGTLTHLAVTSGTKVRSGDVLYTVDLLPVVAAKGSVPAFRTLARGAEGADVRQLQRLLRDLGVRSNAPDGVFGSVTEQQVQVWQRQLGQPQTGRVAAGRLVFVHDLPAVLAWSGQTAVGMSLSPGIELGRMLPPEPRFTITLPQNQASLVDRGMVVTIHGPGPTWVAQLGQIGPPGEDGAATAALEPAAGASSICGEECAQVPADGTGALSSEITVIPPREGPVIPTAALVVGADGTSAVVREDGTTAPVTVLASSGGRAVVQGVVAGDRIRVPGERDAG